MAGKHLFTKHLLFLSTCKDTLKHSPPLQQDSGSSKAYNTYYVAHYRKSLLIPGLYLFIFIYEDQKPLWTFQLWREHNLILLFKKMMWERNKLSSTFKVLLAGLKTK